MGPGLPGREVVLEDVDLSGACGWLDLAHLVVLFLHALGEVLINCNPVDNMAGRQGEVRPNGLPSHLIDRAGAVPWRRW